MTAITSTRIAYDKVTDIFCIVDEFCKNFKKTLKASSLVRFQDNLQQCQIVRSSVSYYYFRLVVLNVSSIITSYYVQRHIYKDLPKTVFYNRFMELSQTVIMPLTIFLKTYFSDSCTGISFVDSTPISVCKNKRIKANKLFKGTAEIGK